MKLNGANLSERLIYYRIHNDQIGKRYIKEQNDYALKIKMSFLEALGINANEEEKKLHLCIFGNGLRESRSVSELEKIEKWLKYLLKVNAVKCILDEGCLINFWASKIYKQGLYYNSFSIWIWSRRSIIRNAENITQTAKFRFFIKSLIRKTNK